MTWHLALDDVAGDKLVAGMAPSVAALRAAGFDAATYTGARLADIDETDASKFPVDAQAGWWLVNGVLVPARPAGHADRVAADIEEFQEAVDREAADIEAMLAREAFAPHTDSGHLWSDDVLHAIAKPHVRLLSLALAAAKASPSSTTIAAYRDGLDRFIAVARDPGLLGIYKAADKSVWRPLRSGAAAYGYDTDTGGIRTVNGNQVMTPVSYPDGETVATWDALAAAEAL